MESSAKLLGHPVHQMLVVFPAGLLVTSVVFDVLHRVNDNPVMATVAFYLIVSGIVGGLVAAPFGTADWLKIPKGTRARSIGAMHGLGNVAALLLFTASAWFRWDSPSAPLGGAQALSFIAAGFMLVTAWMGGELVDRLGIGVCDDVGVNAPSTLKSPSRSPVVNRR